MNFTKHDYEIVKCEVPYEGNFRMCCYQLRFKQYNGSWSKVVSREVVERKSAVAILPYDPILDSVLMIEQFRPGAFSHPVSPWLIEIPAGVYDKDEKPEQVARREAKEEANCEIVEIYPICEYFVSPGGSTEYLHLYCGQIDATNSEGVFGLKEENEDIRTFALSSNAAFDLLETGKIRTSPAIISLQWLKMNREWLRQLWQKK